MRKSSENGRRYEAPITKLVTDAKSAAKIFKELNQPHLLEKRIKLHGLKNCDLSNMSWLVRKLEEAGATNIWTKCDIITRSSWEQVIGAPESIAQAS